ncbi:MAG: 50S ribosomal protein L11 methyltransferase [Gemmatimonadales bacterium]|nr:50S ribosomal protein L11 methyltransferase [Gemmatimonadales bacterium]
MPDSWWAIDVRAPAEVREAVAAWLVARTGQAIEEREDGSLVTFATDQHAADDLIGELARHPGGAVGASRRPLPAVDWSTGWRDGLGPRQFGRLTVTPSWTDGASTADGLTVVLDPETAFGSGEHGSTRAALALLERHLVGGDRVVDLGSGSGILAIAAVKLGASRATGVDIDADSNEVADRNARLNHVSDHVAFLEGDAAELAPLLGPADLLLSNILRTVNNRLLPAIRAALRPGGLAIFSGMEAPEADLFRPVLGTAGFALVDEVVDAAWWAVAARRE